MILPHLLILGDGHASEEDSDLDILEELAEPLVLLADLECELPRVAHHQHRDLAVDRFNLLEGGQYEHCSLAHTWSVQSENSYIKHFIPYRIWLDKERPFPKQPAMEPSIK